MKNLLRISALATVLITVGASTLPATSAQADEDKKSYEVIYDKKGKRVGTIQGDGVTDRKVVYDDRGRRVAVIDKEPDYSKSDEPTVEDFIADEQRREKAEKDPE